MGSRAVVVGTISTVGDGEFVVHEVLHQSTPKMGKYSRIVSRDLFPYTKGARLVIAVEWHGEEFAINRILTETEAIELSLTQSALVDYLLNYKEETQMKNETQQTTDTSDASSPLFGYHINEEARLNFSAAHAMSVKNPEKPVKMLITGPSGLGKTTLPELLAKVSGRGFLRMNCASVRDPEEWFGYREARDGSTVFIPSQFINRVKEGDVVIVLDEFNRVEPWLHNTIYPLLDDAAVTSIHDEEFRVGLNVIFVATINTGYMYTGTFELDFALQNRFDFVLEVKPMSPKEETKVLVERTGIAVNDAALITKVANILRESDFNCSTRDTLRIASMCQTGLLVREAFETAFIKRIPNGSLRKQAIDLINPHVGVYKTRPLTWDVFGTVEVVKEMIADAAGDKNAVLTLKRNKAIEFLNVRVLKMLREMPLAEVDEGDSIDLRGAKKIVDDITAGGTVSLLLHQRLSNEREWVRKFEEAGVKAEFATVKVQP